ncbi:ribosome-associated protein [Desulfobaculum xiamenense]|uniref:Ribosome-associated protein n=1 Tax=Desulfobaculum xiamenense TaxID=995050 RepID=A0A846QXH9_9BACT|nr:ribosome-associated protein [Desulfobaculum xiamenense]
MPKVNNNCELPDRELNFETSRSGGPGGQHVNKVETRVTVVFDVAGSPSLTDAQKARIMTALASRIDTRGVLRVSADDSRSQSTNKALAVERLVELLRQALIVHKKRRPTRPTLASTKRRVSEKKRRGDTKRLRGKVSGDD